MTTPSPTASTDDAPLPAVRPGEAAVDLDADLQLAAFQRQFADADDDGSVPFRQWAVERRIGSGGMGTVYLARHRELGRRVALKIIKTTDGADTKASAARFIREAQALARVDHANVLQIHQVDTSEDPAVIEMEYIPGPTLREWQANPERSWRTIIRAYASAGDGLAAIHQAGLLHRDIKPDNLLIDGERKVKVVDLGLAVADRLSPREVSDTADATPDSALALRLTADGGLVGTLAYMAPEIIGGASATPASDQFSLAASIYEAVYGIRPFLGDSPPELAVAMQDGRLAKPRDTRWRPRWVLRVLRRALSFDPDRRYASVAAFVTALRRWLLVRSMFGGGLGLIVLLSGASLVGWFGKSAPVDVCANVGSEITEVWNADVQRELAVYAAAAASPRVDRSLELLTNILDTRTAGWAATRNQLCVGETKRDIASQPAEAEIDAHQRACLRYTHINIEALVSQLRSTHEDLARNYTETVAAIEALPTCDDRRHLDHWPLAADDDADKDLARALALEAAGRYPDARKLAQKIADASKQDNPFRHAEALFRLGHVLGLERRGQLAFDTLDEARNAAFTLGHDELFCRATAFQAKLTAGVQLDAAAAARELGLAQACAERMGTRSPILRADLLEARGLLAQASDDPLAAMTWHEQALQLRREHLGDDHLDTTKSLLNLANATANAESTEARTLEVRRLYTQCLQLRSATLGDQHPRVADVLFDFGDFLRLRGEFEQAREHLERAQQLYTQASDKHEVAQAKIHLALASMDIEANQLANAEAHVQQARELDAQTQPAIRLYLEGALALRRQDYPTAADSFRRSARLHRQHDPLGREVLDSVSNEIEADYGLVDFTRISALVRDEADELVNFVGTLDAQERGPLAWYIAEALLREAAYPGAAIYLELAMTTYESMGDSVSADELRAQLVQAKAQLNNPTPKPKTPQ